MQNKEFQDSINKITEKLGQEASGLILDDLGILLADNLNMNKEIEQKDNTIADYKQRNEKLLETNSGLFQQIAMAKETAPEVPLYNEPTQTEKKPFDFREAFDEYGNFKK